MTNPILSGNAGAQKPICAICFEDLKPIVEDLQSIHICGHVFHELCLQQWLEYCPVGKKPTCPVCKQSCSHKTVTRLYFQSTGDVVATQSSPRHLLEASAEEMKRLEAKLSVLASNFQNQQLRVKELEEEVSHWMGSMEAAEAHKLELRKEVDCLAGLVREKNEELLRKSTKCSKLEEKNLALAKELASLKLVVDLNLSEDEMVKLASIGHGIDHANAVDVLKRSLALRNNVMEAWAQGFISSEDGMCPGQLFYLELLVRRKRSYKELMAQCNLFGRAESRMLQKLEKTQEKMKKLKSRVQELEKAAEEHENETLRVLKASNRSRSEQANMDSAKWSTCTVQHALRDQTRASVVIANSSQESKLIKHSNHSRTDVMNTVNQNNHLAYGRVQPKINEDEAAQSSYVSCQQVSSLPDAEVYTDPKTSLACQSLTSGNGRKSHGQNHELNASEGIVDDDITYLSSVTRDAQDIHADASHSIQEETDHALETVSYPGNAILPGLSVHEVAHGSMGKWSKLSENKASLFLRKQASTSNGTLISVGADGRGGRIKTLRTHHQYWDGKELCPKRFKHEGNQSGQSQIEHFFGRQKSH